MTPLEALCTEMVESLAFHRRDEEARDASEARAACSARAEATSPTVCLRRSCPVSSPRMGGANPWLGILRGKNSVTRAACERNRAELAGLERARLDRAGAMIARLRTLLSLPAAFVTGGYISRTILRRCLRVFRLAASRALATHLYHNLHQPPRVAGAFLV